MISHNKFSVYRVFKYWEGVRKFFLTESAIDFSDTNEGEGIIQRTDRNDINKDY